MVENLGKVFGTQDAGAYTLAVQRDVIPYINQLSAGLQHDENVAPRVQAVSDFLWNHVKRVGEIIQDTIKQPNEFFSNFLKRLREYSQSQNARFVVEALQDKNVRRILRSALIAGVSRYVASVHGAVTVNGVPIQNPVLKDGIIGLVLANLNLISP
jgi:hypothetical protein